MRDARDSDLPDEELAAYIEPRLRDYFTGLFDQHGPLGATPSAWDLVNLDIELNAQGIAIAANKERRKARETAG